MAAIKSLYIFLTIFATSPISVPTHSSPATAQWFHKHVDCWSELDQIRACSSEISAYFASGVKDISTPCCNAVVSMTHDCWPGLLSTLGYTPEEGDVLRGYCDAVHVSDRGTGIPPAASPIAGPPLMAEMDG